MKKIDFIACRMLFPAVALMACIAAYSNGNWQHALSSSCMAFYAWIYYDAEYGV